MQTSEPGRSGDDPIEKAEAPDRWEAALRREYRRAIWARRIAGEWAKTISLFHVVVLQATVVFSRWATEIREVFALLG
jgi:hypothetical protein